MIGSQFSNMGVIKGCLIQLDGPSNGAIRGNVCISCDLQENLNLIFSILNLHILRERN